jgi:hypothetical protein
MGKYEGMKKVILFLFFCGVLSGCVSASRPAVYRNDILNDVFAKDKELAIELSRIPGVNTPRSPYGAAIKALSLDYRNPAYRPACEEIMGLGNPTDRPFAPGLEALVWLYSHDPDEARRILVDFDLDTLLSASWGALRGPAWQDWRVVRGRLTAPPFAEYYARTALTYIPERGDGKNYLQSPAETLLMGGGDCEDFAALIIEGLEFGGYYARLFTVDIYTEKGKKLRSHTVAAYREDHQWYFIQGFDGKYLTGGITGPFDQAYELANYIADSIGGVPLYYYIDTIFEFLEAYEHLNRGRP